MTSTPTPVRTLTVRFDDLPLRADAIHRFRGQVVAAAAQPDDRLHNHAPDGASLYRYPLVQYRVWQGRATLFGIGEGVDTVRAFLATLDQTPYQALPARTEVGLCEQPLRYAIGQWWPMNTENLHRWKQTTGLANRVRLLEGILTNQLLAVCEAIGYRVPNRGLHVEIQELTEAPARRFATQQATQPLQARLFGLVYTANLRLPEGLGVGKGVSKGFGVQMPVGPGWQLHKRQRPLTSTPQNHPSDEP